MWTMPDPSSSETKSAGTISHARPRTASAGMSSNGRRYPAPISSAAGTTPPIRSSPKSFSARLRASTSRLPASSTSTYSISGLTASAALDTSVHGVVVHTKACLPDPSRSSRVTQSDGSSTSLYPSESSCDASTVWSEGHHGTTWWPLYRSPLSAICLRIHQIDSTYSAWKVTYGRE